MIQEGSVPGERWGRRAAAVRRVPLRAETEAWWRQAEADLRAADWNRQGGIYYAASWFAQQSAEKALKALFIGRRGELPPRTHAVQYLGRDLGVPEPVQADLDALAPVFGQVRYPEPASAAPVDSIDAESAGRHLAAAQRVLAWIDGELQR